MAGKSATPAALRIVYTMSVRRINPAAAATACAVLQIVLQPEPLPREGLLSLAPLAPGGVNFVFYVRLALAWQNTSKLAFALAYPYSGFAEDTSPQQNCKQVCFCFRLIRILASPKILPLGKIQVNLLLLSLIRTLASPKILPLGKIQVNLLLLSLIRIFAL